MKDESIRPALRHGLPTMVLLLLFGTAQAAVADEAPTDPRPILAAMADFLGAAAGFGVVVQRSHDAVQDDDWEDLVIAGAVVAGTAAVVGAAAASTRYVYYSTLPCTATTVLVGGITYFHCGTVWYGQVYAGSGIS